MITVVIDVFLLKRNRWIYGSYRNRVTWFKNRAGLSVNTGTYQKNYAVPASPGTWMFCDGLEPFLFRVVSQSAEDAAGG